MTGLAMRVAVLAVVGLGVWGSVHAWSRRPVRTGAVLPPGMWVVTGPACAWCEQVAGVIKRRRVPARLVGYDDERVRPLGLQSLPTVLVADADGRIVARRSGRLAIDHLDRMIDLAAKQRNA